MVFLLLFFNIVFAQDCDFQEPVAIGTIRDFSHKMAKQKVDEYVNKADPCLMNEFSDVNIIVALTGFNFGYMMPTEITTKQLRDLAGEIAWPTRFNKLYEHHLNRPELRGFLIGLADQLEKNGVTRLSTDQLRSAAAYRTSNAIKNGEIGECYNLESFGGAKHVFGSVSRSQSVSVADQKKIEEIMSKAQDQGYHFSDMDGELFKNKRLSIEELKELKALREASAAFEQATFLKNDDAGGFFSNLKGEFGGGDQVNCALEAQNHKVFLNKLKEKGLLKNFEVSGEATRPREVSKKDFSGSGHVAVLLKNKRTGEEFVYDSWFEKGGEAAHILALRDWKKLSLDLKNDFKDVVPLSK